MFAWAYVIRTNSGLWSGPEEDLLVAGPMLIIAVTLSQWPVDPPTNPRSPGRS